MTLSEKIKELAKAREAREVLRDQAIALQKELEQTEQYQKLDNAMLAINEQKVREEELDAEVRALALEEYNTTKDKRPVNGVEIKVTKDVEVTDEKGLLTWCINNFTPALTLKKDTVKNAAKDGSLPEEYVLVKDEPKAYIASDLSVYLG